LNKFSLTSGGDEFTQQPPFGRNFSQKFPIHHLYSSVSRFRFGYCQAVDVTKPHKTWALNAQEHQMWLLLRSFNGVRHINEVKATSSPVSTGIGDDLWPVYHPGIYPGH